MSEIYRRTKRINVAYTAAWHRRGHVVEAIVADINEHGMFIRTDLDAQPGEALSVTLRLPDGPLAMVVIARFVGKTHSGRGVGAEIFVIGDDEGERWARHYWRLIRQRDGLNGDLMGDFAEQLTAAPME